MAITLDGNLGITFPSGSVQNNAVANNAAITALVGSRGLSNTIVPTGSVIQVVQVNNTGTFNTSSSSMVTTGFSATITPQLSSSKILIQINGVYGSAYNNNFGYGQIYRNGSGIAQQFFLGSELSQNNGNRTTSQFSYQYLDTPSSTSALTYTLYVECLDGNNIWVGRWAQDSNWTQPTSFTLWEIAG
jgi:hypothetical protein